ncbi:MAG: GNAT family N-acetyltransferase [Phycisphaerales bacterium]
MGEVEVTAGVVIRGAVAADVERVLPMVAGVVALHEEWDSARYGALPDVIERYRRWLPGRASDPRSVFLVAEAPAALVGFVVASVESNIPIYKVEEFGFVHDMWVEPAWRGRGIARGLATACVERFGAMGVRQIRLETAWRNEGARRVFRAAGFRETAVEMALDLPSPTPERDPT